MRSKRTCPMQQQSSQSAKWRRSFTLAPGLSDSKCIFQYSSLGKVDRSSRCDFLVLHVGVACSGANQLPQAHQARLLDLPAGACYADAFT